MFHHSTEAHLAPNLKNDIQLTVTTDWIKNYDNYVGGDWIKDGGMRGETETSS